MYSVIFWAMMAVMAVATFVDSGLFVSIGLVGILFSVILLYGFSVVMAFVISHLAYVVVGFILYFLVGSTWSVFKWWRYCKWVRHQYDLYSKEEPSLQGKELMVSFLSFNRHGITSIPPVASNKKSDISLWIVAWPFSLIEWAVGDLIGDLLKQIIDSLGGIYSRISKGIFKDIS